MIKVEVCAESVRSAVTAQECGAWRVELCDNLAEGGTTPSYGTITEARKLLNIKLYPIVRPRGGDFLYTDLEYGIMRRDVAFCGEQRCDGVVIGILTADGRVDAPRTRALVELAHGYGMGVTFHRAFDVCRDRCEALETIIETGCERILTSGGEATASEGVEELRRLVGQAAGRISIMPGSGITPENAARIVERTGCGEIHGTMRSRYPSRMDFPAPAWADHDVWHADPEKVRAVVKAVSRY